jgi:hypothetical protein
VGTTSDEKIVADDTAFGVFRRPPATGEAGTWVEEDTEEQPVVVDDDLALPPPPPRNPRHGVLIVTAVIVVSVLSAVGAYALLTRGNNGRVPTGGPLPAGAATRAPQPTSSRVVSALQDGQPEHDFELVTDTNVVTVRATDLADRMFEISTPPDGEALPDVTVQGKRVTLQLVPTGRNGPGGVEVKLSTRVRWTVRLSGGAVEHRVDMSAGRVASVDVLGGARRLELSLPAPEGTTTVRMTGGVNQFLVHLAAGIPVRVRVGSGASTVTVDDQSRSRIAPGTVLTPADWATAERRYDIDAVAGFSALRVDRG